MRNYRYNPESDENNQATCDNQRAVFAAQMEAKTSEHWEVKYHVQNKNSETQSVGFATFDHKPSDEDINDLRENLLIENVWAARVLIVG
jgi:serine protease inhibitor ecotin